MVERSADDRYSVSDVCSLCPAVGQQDMNEPANFGTNEDRPWNWPEDARPYWSLKCPTGPLDDPPYRTSQ